MSSRLSKLAKRESVKKDDALPTSGIPAFLVSFSGIRSSNSNVPEAAQRDAGLTRNDLPCLREVLLKAAVILPKFMTPSHRSLRRFHFLGAGCRWYLPARASRGCFPLTGSFRNGIGGVLGGVLLGCLMMVLQLEAAAPFNPIQLSGGPLVKMAADHQRPYVYALQAPAAGATNGHLLIVDIVSGSLWKTVSIVSDPADFAISSGDDRLYILDRTHGVIDRIDLDSQVSLPAFDFSGLSLSSVNGLNSGRFLTGGHGKWFFCNTSTGMWVTTNWIAFDGDSEVDASGSFFFMGSVGVWPAMVLRWNIEGEYLAAGAPALVQQMQSVHWYGSYNLLLSRDNSRLFYNGNVYDTNLNHLAWLGAEVFACSSDGKVAFTSSKVLDGISWLPMYDLPVTSTVMTVDRNDQRFWFYNSSSNRIESLPMSLVQKPVILQQPANQVVMSGNTAVISVVASGRAPLFYSWFLNGTNIAFTSTNQIFIPHFQPANSGLYSVTVTNGFGSVASSNAAVTASLVPPAFTSHPSDVIIAAGSNAVLNASAAGSLPISYQWRRNGVNIAGATNAILTITNTGLAHEGSYDAVAANDFGSTNSAAAWMNVVDMAEALNTTNLNWVAAGDVPWRVQFYNAVDGYAAVQSGVITNGQESILRTTVTGPGMLTFWWSIDSAYTYGCNFLIFSANGVEQSRISFVTGWTPMTNYIREGEQVLQWTFTQPIDSAVWPTSYMDQVRFIPGGTSPALAVSPSDQVAIIGSAVTIEATAFGTPPLRYQWQFNGADLDDATNSTLVLTNIQFANEGSYRLVISNAFGVTNTAAVSVDVVDFSESINSTNLTWVSIGNQPWFPQTAVSHDGVAALQSGAIGGGQQSGLSTTITGPGTLSFWWRTSSETNNDYLNFTIDGVEQARRSGSANLWQLKTFFLTNGVHVLSWNYSKNATINSGADAAWLDEVSFAPGGTAAFAINGPTDQMVPVSGNATFIVEAGGTPPVSYQWFFEDTPIPFATNASLTITNVQVIDSGNYAVSLSNAYGNSRSENAFLHLLNLHAWGAGRSNTGVPPIHGQSIVPTNLTGIKAVSGGGFHTLVLRHDGRVAAWGHNVYGQTNIPGSLTNVAAISAGLNHNIALRSNGTVSAWTMGNYGLTVVPPAATNVVTLAAGWYHNLVLRSNGTVVAWGAGTSYGSFPYFGQSLVPTNLTGVKAIAAGGYHSLALRSNGTVVAWGWNAFGQTNVPSGLSNVVAVAAGASNSLALRRDGTLIAWGANGHGQSSIPDSLTNVVAIRCGAAHCMALRRDGSLVNWGLNTHGQTNVPASLTNVAAVSAGGFHSLALVNTGPITFLNAPHGRTVFKGEQAVFDPAVLGLEPIRFQWQRNGTNVPNATNAVLQIADVKLIDSGVYQLLASNAFGLVTSESAFLTVKDTAPTFVVHPVNAAVPENFSTNLSAVVEGWPPFWFQWRKNGTAIVGATNLTLTITNAQLTDEGLYSLIASNTHGFAVSSNAVVDVIDLAQALGTNVSWHSVGAPLWFAQVTNTHDGFAAAASGPIRYGNYNLLQTVVSGPGKLTFWCTGGNGTTMSFAIDDIAQTSQSFYIGSPWRQLSYELSDNVHLLTWTASNQSSLASTNMVFLDEVVFTPGFKPVQITGHPVSLVRTAGNSATFTVSVTGTPPFKYQWHFKDAPIPNATSATLQLNNVQAANAGAYFVVVTGPQSVVSSATGTLSVLPSAPVFNVHPIGRKVLLGTSLSMTAGAIGSEPMHYQWLLNSIPVPGASNSSVTIAQTAQSNGGWYSVTASNSAGVAISSNALIETYSAQDIGIALENPDLVWATTDVPWFPQTNVTHDGVSAAQSGTIKNAESSVLQATATGPAMVTYWWKVNCDKVWNALAFSANGVEQSSIGGNVDWQRVTNYIGSGAQILQWKLYPIHNAFAGGTAWVDQVEVIPMAGSAPSIVSQSSNTVISAGNNVTLSVTATGTPPLRYQWQLNGDAIPDRTNSTLTLNNVQAGSDGTYSVLVTNDFGFTISTNITLTVNSSAPVITVKPASQTNVFNSAVTFSVTAKGSAPMSYQWFFKDVAISGANSNLFVMPHLHAANAGSYHVVVSNQYGSATSLAAILTLVPSKVLEFFPNGYSDLQVPGSIGNVVAVAAGYRHTVALRQDGTVIAWGVSFLGQTNVPAGLSNVVAIAAGDNHSIALKADGSLVAWGDYGYGQGGVPAGLSNVLAIASGPKYNLALKTDGTVVGWGDNTSGQTDLPDGLTGVQAVFAGHFNGFALKSDGTLVQWGSGPVWKRNGVDTELLVSGSNVTSVAAAGFNGWSLNGGGTVVSHGFSDGSAPSTNIYGASSSTSWGTQRGPRVYQNIKAIAAAGEGTPFSEYVLLLDNDGFITKAGPNASYSDPVISPNPGNVTAVSANKTHAVALISDGSPYLERSPIDRIVFTGGNVTFSVRASGAWPLNYQWKFNGTNIAAATNAALILTNVPLAAAGNYACFVSNSSGSASSRSATLVVLRSTPYFDAVGTSYAGSNGFRFKLNQLSGHGPLVIYASTNLLDWISILTNPPQFGSFEFFDADATNMPARFYRAEEH